MGGCDAVKAVCRVKVEFFSGASAFVRLPPESGACLASGVEVTRRNEDSPSLEAQTRRLKRSAMFSYRLYSVGLRFMHSLRQ